jgi:3-oxoacyl-[acyl-carrier-protein] synthase II
MTSDGFVMGEGGAFVVLEELTHALARGAKIYAEVLGHGRSCEAYHPMAPHPDGAGIKRAMEKTLHKARVTPSAVQYINVHGTANEMSDLAEVRAIKGFFGAHAKRLAVSSTKPVTGHPLATAGALETVICSLAILHQEIPMTLNLEDPRPECDLDFVQGHSRPYPLQTVMSLNSGFGGKTSCLLLGQYQPGS